MTNFKNGVEFIIIDDIISYMNDKHESKKLKPNDIIKIENDFVVFPDGYKMKYNNLIDAKLLGWCLDGNIATLKKDGIKYDNNKPRLSEMILDFKKPLLGLCKVWEFGAEKYGKSNWKELDNAKDRYLNAFYRHSFKMIDEEIDEESGLPHYYHMLFNAMAYAYFSEKESEKVKE